MDGQRMVPMLVLIPFASHPIQLYLCSHPHRNTPSWGGTTPNTTHDAETSMTIRHTTRSPSKNP